MTTTETRDRIVAHLRGAGWVAAGDLVRWMRDECGLTIGQGERDLRTLVLAGRIERRVGAARPGSWARSYEYRVTP